MPAIRSSADLRNKYTEISSFCHQSAEPVFITKNGKGDLAILSIEAYEKLIGRFELYSRLLEGRSDIKAESTSPLPEILAEGRAEYKNAKNANRKEYSVNRI